jgi:hypothetical protein
MLIAFSTSRKWSTEGARQAAVIVSVVDTTAGRSRSVDERT